MVCDLVMPWVIPVTLLAMNGRPYDRDFLEPTPAAHTECRLSRVGRLVLAAESGAFAPIPVGMINGTWWRGAAQPPLDPSRVIGALRQLLDEPAMPDDKLLQMAGGPISLTGSELTGDFHALAQGQRATIREAPRITRTGVPVPPAAAEPPRKPAGPLVLTSGTRRPPEPAHLIVDAVPRHLSVPEVHEEISSQIRPEGWQPPEPPSGSLLQGHRERMMARALPIAETRDESHEEDIRVAIMLRPGADPHAVQAQLARLHALSIDRDSQFPVPLPELLRSWVASRRREDIGAGLNGFEAAFQADRQEAAELAERGRPSGLNRRDRDQDRSRSRWTTRRR
jgi:hypothetical protein